jgi:hypothetical protein
MPSARQFPFDIVKPQSNDAIFFTLILASGAPSRLVATAAEDRLC